MGKLISLTIIIFFLNHCSFNQNSKIWTGDGQIKKKETKDNLELIFKKENDVSKDINLLSSKRLIFEKSKVKSQWNQRFQNRFNDTNNFAFLNQGEIKKFSKISRHKINKNILFYKNNLFFSDIKGNIGVLSLTKNKIIYKFNFYKKKLKKQNKNIKLIIKDDIIVAADNFGYIYSLDYKKNKIKWAKNYLLPFRSNLKILDNRLFLSDEKNKIIIINLATGDKIDEFYTQPSKTVSKFENNLSFDNLDRLIFLSTNGTLYSLTLNNQKIINWINNFNIENEIIFNAFPVLISDNKLFISTNKSITMLNDNGAKNWSIRINNKVAPIISGNFVITISDKNYLVIIEKKTGEILFSKNLFEELNKKYHGKNKKKVDQINKIHISNNNLILIANNSYFIEFNLKDDISVETIKKNPFKINSDIIFVDQNMIFVGQNNKVYSIN